MSDLNEKKQKFLEILLTLGSLLAVFLGFVVEKTGALLNYLVAFGVAFTISALFAYAAGLFPERIHGSFRREGVIISRFALAISFAGLVTIGTTFAFGLSIGGNTLDAQTTLVVGAAFFLSFLGTYGLILRVMNTT